MSRDLPLKEVSPGARFGHLVVIEEMTGTEASHPMDGRWCRVKCDCGTRKQVRARHLRRGELVTCGNTVSCEFARERVLKAAATTRASAMRTCRHGTTGRTPSRTCRKCLRSYVNKWWSRKKRALLSEKQRAA